MQWDFRTVEYFLKVAETLSFKKAAEELYISTQAINKPILQMEKQLGRPLFERDGRQLRLTQAGMLLYDRFRPVKHAYDEARRSIETELGNAKDQMRVIFFQALPKKVVVSQIVNYLLAQSPALDILLEAAELEDATNELRAGRADLCITSTHEYDDLDGLEVISLAKTPARIAVSLNHPWVVKEEITPADMAEASILLMDIRQDHNETSFYNKAKSLPHQYVANHASLLAKLDLARHYTVFPQVFENVLDLCFFDLPEPLRFTYELVCLFKKDNKYAAQFRQLRDYFEAAPLEMGS